MRHAEVDVKRSRGWSRFWILPAAGIAVLVAVLVAGPSISDLRGSTGRLAVGPAAAVAQTPSAALPPGAEGCVDCHVAGRQGRRVPGEPPKFDAAALLASPHAGVACTDCHMDLAGVEMPHPEKLAPVDCGTCHDEIQTQYDESLHGQAGQRGDPLAPTCKSCHGDARSCAARPTPLAQTAVMNIPLLCGTLPPRRLAGPAHALDPAGQHPRELLGVDPRRGAVQEGADRHRGLHELPHRAPRAAAHRSALLDRARTGRQDLHQVPRPDRARAPQGDPRRAVGEAAPHDPGLRRLPLAAQGAQGVLHAGHGRPGLHELPRPRPTSSRPPGWPERRAPRRRGRAGRTRATPGWPASSATPSARRRWSAPARPCAERWTARSATPRWWSSTGQHPRQARRRRAAPTPRSARTATAPTASSGKARHRVADLRRATSRPSAASATARERRRRVRYTGTETGMVETTPSRSTARGCSRAG